MVLLYAFFVLSLFFILFLGLVSLVGAAPYGWNLGKVVVGRLPAGLALARRLKFSVFRNSHSVHIPNHGHREVFRFFLYTTKRVSLVSLPLAPLDVFFFLFTNIKSPTLFFFLISIHIVFASLFVMSSLWLQFTAMWFAPTLSPFEGAHLVSR